MNRDYYHFLSGDEKAVLAEEYLAGPQPAYEGVHPEADDGTRLRIGEKRFVNKFERNDPCPKGYYPPDFVQYPAIKDRLIKDGYLT